MTSYQWKTNKYRAHVYGRIINKKNKYLFNTNGIEIHPQYGVRVAYFNEDSCPTKPFITFRQNSFKIME
jgi:hypothetical protein